MFEYKGLIIESENANIIKFIHKAFKKGGQEAERRKRSGESGSEAKSTILSILWRSEVLRRPGMADGVPWTQADGIPLTLQQPSDLGADLWRSEAKWAIFTDLWQLNMLRQLGKADGVHWWGSSMSIFHLANGGFGRTSNLKEVLMNLWLMFSIDDLAEDCLPAELSRLGLKIDCDCCVSTGGILELLLIVFGENSSMKILGVDVATPSFAAIWMAFFVSSKEDISELWSEVADIIEVIDLMLFFEDQVLLVKDLKDLKFFGFSLINMMRVVMIISLVGFGNDEAGYWLIKVVVGVVALHWNITGAVLASMIGVVMIFSLYDFACEEADSWTIEEGVGDIALSLAIGSFLVVAVDCVDATTANSTLDWSLLDPMIVGASSFYQRKMGFTEAVQTGVGQLNSIPIAIGVMDFQFMGGSMGSIVDPRVIVDELCNLLRPRKSTLVLRRTDTSRSPERGGAGERRREGKPTVRDAFCFANRELEAKIFEKQELVRDEGKKRIHFKILKVMKKSISNKMSVKTPSQMHNLLSICVAKLRFIEPPSANPSKRCLLPIRPSSLVKMGGNRLVNPGFLEGSTKSRSFLDALSVIPIWISFHNSQLHLFSPRILHGLGLLFGRPLKVDFATAMGSQSSIVHVLVELDITKKYTDKVWLR
ncbi:hypothetical protein KFK09_008713 [Dendrobium nobile]|uniref:DUF4283 domain-containing protein n=1 Tax=Dendrobium nobile TaxID=94219 RepID=A0A8T3BLG3_DENNO|nr:hypothetical protein KFK09_008713 [Dendrobium nobile]